MRFLIQKKLVDERDLDTQILLNKLKEPQFKYIHSVEYCDISEIGRDRHENMIPVGNIDFVSEYVRKYYGIEHQHPIEIPKILREYKFLKRDYSIVNYNELPTKGLWFIKDASQLKVFSYSGDISFLEGCWNDTKEYSTALKLDKEHLYQVSEIVDILAEFRVYVIGGKIEAITQYDGKPGIFPDTQLIEEAHNLYVKSGDAPRSYTMDIMVTPRGTSIIEIHNFTSVGLYTVLFGDSLVYAYRDALDYIIDKNIKPSKTRITKENN
ncbi:MAG: ATP-grasp domain-containing protein [Lachnospiraceae bacterium]|nr:ATP-grasp domain-containing protein [Lachnospiraceae bacterium]